MTGLSRAGLIQCPILAAEHTAHALEGTHMLDLKFIRDHSGLVKDAIRVKHVNLDLDELLRIDRELLDVRQRVETLQAERNANARAVPKASKEEKPELIEKGKALGEEIKALEPALRAHEDALRQLLLRVPNLPLPGVPEGVDD